MMGNEHFPIFTFKNFFSSSLQLQTPMGQPRRKVDLTVDDADGNDTSNNNGNNTDEDMNTNSDDDLEISF